MRRRLVTVVLGALLPLLAGILVVAAPADAEVVGGRDPVADVRRLGEDDLSSGTLVGRHPVDLVGFRVRYADGRIRGVLRYRDLTRTGRRFFAGLLLDFPAGSGGRDYADLTVHATPRDRAGTSRLGRVGDDEDAEGQGQAARTVPCRTAHRIDYRRDRVVMSMPASCIGEPRLVRAFVGTYVDGGRGLVLDAAPGDHLGDDGDDRTVRVRRD